MRKTFIYVALTTLFSTIGFAHSFDKYLGENLNSNVQQHSKDFRRGGPAGGSMLTQDLIEKLSLTQEQISKWKEDEKAFQLKMEEMRPDGTQKLSRKEMKAKMDSLMEEREKSIRANLTEEQYKLYQEYKEKNRPKRFEGGPNGGFPPGNFGNPGEF